MKNEKGQAMVEFALVLPILLILFLGIIDFGRILYTKSAVTSLSQGAARHASIYYASEDNTAIRNYITSNAGTLSTSEFKKSDGTDGIVIVFTPSRTSGSDATVTITYKIYFITPIVNFIPSMQNPFYITSTATFRVE